MSDPVGLISGAGGVEGPRLPAGGRPIDPNAPAFKDVLLKNLNQVNKLQQDANRAIEDLATGERSDVEGVILATQQADIAFRMLQSVRNKVMDAIEEIKQVRV